MSENMNFTFTLENRTGNNLALKTGSNSTGRWSSAPGAQINNNSAGKFKAMGRGGGCEGVAGSVAWSAFDGSVFTVNYEVPYTGANSGNFTAANSSDPGSPSTTFDFGFASYSQKKYSLPKTPTSFPTSGDAVVLYGLIELKPQPSAALGDSASVDARLSAMVRPSAGQARRSEIDLETFLGEYPIGNKYTPADIRRFFGSNNSVTMKEILEQDAVAADDRVNAALSLGFLSPAASLEAAICCANFTSFTFKKDAELSKLGQMFVEMLAAAEAGEDVPGFANTYQAIREAHAVQSVRRTSRLPTPMEAACETLLAPVDVAAEDAALRAFGCSLATAQGDEQKRSEIAKWQLDYLKQLADVGAC